MPAELLNEKIIVGPYEFELDETGVTITDHDDDEERVEGQPQHEGDFSPFVDLHPTNRRDANQLSMALRKASKRLEEIARTLPTA